jgi:peroxiredoxin
MTGGGLVPAVEEAFREARDLDAPLNHRLSVVADRVRTLNPVFAEGVDRLIARLQHADAGAGAPGVGDAMPNFVLPDQSGRLVTLEAAAANGPVAISFNRGHWCPYCRLNLAAMADAYPEIAATGGQVLAIVPERQRFTAVLTADTGATFPVLTDMDNGYALSLNLAVWVGAEMTVLIARAGWDIPKYQDNNTWVLPIPATFVVGTDGIIVARHIEPDYRRRMEMADLITSLRLAATVRTRPSPLREAD